MPTLADQLRNVLDDEDISQRGLAVRLAKRTGSTMESERRWLRKVLKGEVKHPERASLDALEDELGKPRGYFTVPTRAQRREAEQTELQDTRRRLAALEKRFDDFVEATVARLASLEEPPAQQAQQ